MRAAPWTEDEVAIVRAHWPNAEAARRALRVAGFKRSERAVQCERDRETERRKA